MTSGTSRRYANAAPEVLMVTLKFQTTRERGPNKLHCSPNVTYGSALGSKCSEFHAGSSWGNTRVKDKFLVAMRETLKVDTRFRSLVSKKLPSTHNAPIVSSRDVYSTIQQKGVEIWGLEIILFQLDWTRDNGARSRFSECA